MKTDEMRSQKHNSRFGLGVVLVIVGSILLAGKLGYITPNVYDVLLSWPMILIAVAVVSFIKKDYVPGTMLLSIGIFFLLPDLLPEFSSSDALQYWPVLLIFGGVLFIFRRKSHSGLSGINVDDNDVIDELNVFGGSTSNMESKNFKGGKITCIFGGGEMSFANSKLAEKGAVIDVIAMFGGFKLMVPHDWNVKVEVVSIFGGFTDKRVFSRDSISDGKTLLIKGITIFGGGELRSI